MFANQILFIYLFFSCCHITGLTAVVVSLSLPETRGIDCIETVEEAEYFYKHKHLMKANCVRLVFTSFSLIYIVFVSR